MEWILRVGSGCPNLSGLHPGIDAVVRAALAHDPRDRPSAWDLAAICQEGIRDVRGPQQTFRPRPAVRSAEAASTATAARDAVGFW
jgi:hypothetical protein